jgi:hypothetical protein
MFAYAESILPRYDRPSLRVFMMSFYPSFEGFEGFQGQGLSGTTHFRAHFESTHFDER